MPENERRYSIRIQEQDLFFLPSELEAIEVTSDTFARYSSEWTAELTRFLGAGQRLLANNNDQAALSELSESGRKLGFIVSNS